MSEQWAPRKWHRAVSAHTRIQVARRDGGRCRYCGASACLTFDHVIPLSRCGGFDRNPNWEWNIVLACKKCNYAKANRTPEEAGMALRKAGWWRARHISPVYQTVRDGSGDGTRRVTSAIPENEMTPACVNTRGPGQTRGNSHDQ